VTPLMRAADTGDIEMVRAVIAQKANAKAKDRSGRTASDWAKARDDESGKAIAVLIDATE